MSENREPWEAWRQAAGGRPTVDSTPPPPDLPSYGTGDAIIVAPEPSRTFLAGFPPSPRPRETLIHRRLPEIEPEPPAALVDGHSPIILAENDTNPEPEPVDIMDARYAAPELSTGYEHALEPAKPSRAVKFKAIQAPIRSERVRVALAEGRFVSKIDFGTGVPKFSIKFTPNSKRKDTRDRRTKAPIAPVPDGYPEPAHVGSRVHPHSPEVKAAKNRLHVRNHYLRKHGHPDLDAYVSADGRIIIRATGLELVPGTILIGAKA